MQVRNLYLDDTAKDIIWEFENLLSEKEIKINNKDPNENKFEKEDSYINIKDYEELKENIIKQLQDFEDFLKYYAA